MQVRMKLQETKLLAPAKLPKASFALVQVPPRPPVVSIPSLPIASIPSLPVASSPPMPTLPPIEINEEWKSAETVFGSGDGDLGSPEPKPTVVDTGRSFGTRPQRIGTFLPPFSSRVSTYSPFPFSSRSTKSTSFNTIQTLRQSLRRSFSTTAFCCERKPKPSRHFQRHFPKTSGKKIDIS